MYRLSKYCKINLDGYFKEKLEQTIEFLKKNFLNKEGFFGSAYDADSEGEEGKYYIYSYSEIKDLDPEGKARFIHNYIYVEGREVSNKVSLKSK